jgi:hypothetical protein
MASRTLKNQLARSAAWLERLPPEQWAIYKTVMVEAQRRGLQFAIGGGFATMTYTRQWRKTKDIDLYIVERNKEEMIRVLSDSGLKDYYEQESYQRHWIYRSYKNDVIVDVIWAMANQRAAVDENWLRGPALALDGERFRLVPAEETLWSKLYVLQRERCDWPDALSLLYTVGVDLNWRHVLERVKEDGPLLAALLSVFAWLCPHRARELPSWVWGELGARRDEADPHLAGKGNRASLLDSRPWFTSTIDEQSGQNRKDA